MNFPHYLDSKAEVISFSCASAMINNVKNGLIPANPMHIVSDKNHHSITFHAIKKRNRAIRIDSDRYIVDVYMSEFLKYNTVISFKKTFGNVSFPVPFEEIVPVTPIFVLDISSYSPLQQKSMIFRNEIMTRMDDVHNEYGYGKYPQDFVHRPPSKIPGIKTKEFFTQSIVKKSLRTQLKKVHYSKFENGTEYNESEEDESDFEDIIISKGKFEIHYPDIPYGGESSPFFGSKKQSPFGRLSC
ncbi:hypothetical protein BN7_3702 [Wickerhamomyces ciferrii]|uniref:Uncharacterized protein n=1 Tax=Wickerhamomyces ciferrii (strain ATCC 14091 / BCRC 22168 / CBS 111 / JCM 3599 / NBRC 0793 / NRRL Y-1031 F-60-10) TaxID=1206466 RepID=K0KS33_WICCF|nr:uncharacterized protein BN7_3702 [Wickerhamomyces ciferrii]CCH44144.1 hypothetical protein BN7_3702 [Wickerhamomyces ciferrii]